HAQATDLTVTQTPVGGSGVTATTTLTAVGNQTTITVAARGLTPGSTTNSEVHFGTVANPGAIAFDLGNLVAGADGTATATTTVNASLASLQDGNHFLHIHVLNAEGAVLANGDIPMAAAVAAATPSVVTATPAATAAAVATATPSATVVAVAASPAALPSAGEDPGAGSQAGLPGIVAAAAVVALLAGVVLRRRTI
ncbi:MAG TPA: hypothetical protein VHS06_00185, partial [Chloroflexota bacterium]|nr:hypothetical protein [Chloroflexota bacterium]